MHALRQTGLLFFGFCVLPVAAADNPGQRIDLAGDWTVRLDSSGQKPDGAAASEEAASQFQHVTLPGTLRDSGLGNPVGPKTRWIAKAKDEVWNRPEYKKYQDPGNFKVPNWLQPERHYVGPASYQRRVEIPKSWRGQRVLLTLERPHWRTEVWVDGRFVGSNNSLSTPHVYDVTKRITPGQHTLTVSVNNALDVLDVGVNSHSVSDHTQSAWHGIVGEMELRAGPPVAIKNVQVVPAKDARSARIKLRLANVTGHQQDGTIALRVSQDDEVLGERTRKFTAAKDDATIDCVLPFYREAKRWDEFHPSLCQLEVTLDSVSKREPTAVAAGVGEPIDASARPAASAVGSGEPPTATKQVSFGIRHIDTAGTQFVLNGRPLFLRGTLECCIFPLTGYPPTDVESWRRIIRICKAHGLNHIRFHSWCPPEAAFVAADELGFYYQVECSTWPNVSTKLGDGLPIDQWLYREGERILEAYGNHPSFLLLAMGNEPAGPERGGKYLGPWVEHFKAKTDRQLVTSGSGWPSIAENEFHVTPRPRIQQWGQGLRSRINAEPPATLADYRDFVGGYDVPVISHEIGQWCVYPNFDEMKKYSGSLKPRNFEIFQDLLAEAQMPDQARDFLMASGKLQALCYKEEIESALRTPGFGGFQLLDLHDFPGQGTALVGVLDPFWDSKPYISPDEFRQFCGPTVPLARLPKRMWTSDETLIADIEVSHFGPDAMPDVTTRWMVKRGGELVTEGALPKQDVPTGKLMQLGRIQLPLERFDPLQQLTFTVSLAHGDQLFVNDWQFWVYPAQTNESKNVSDDLLVVDAISDDVAKRLKAGGKVVLFLDPNTVQTDVTIGFSSIFWNTSWTDGQPPHTLGILCDPDHPALAHFPTDYHSDWQWWELVSRSKPMVLDKLPEQLRPIVQVVPDWFRPQRLGLVFEAKVGQGKLLVCSVDLKSDLDNRPVARQMRHSLLQYAASDAFAPQASVDLDAVGGLFREPTMLQKIGATIEADSAHDNHPAQYAIDGDPKTIWHTDWEPSPVPMPHALVLDLGKPRQVNSVRYVPRQDMTNGRIAEYAIHVSDDGQDWGSPVASGTFPPGAEPHSLRFAQTHSTRFIKLIVNREVNDKPYASVAEIDVLFADEAPPP